MSKYLKRLKDFRQRQFYQVTEKKRIFHKFFLRQSLLYNLPGSRRYIGALQELPRIKHINICLLTGRSRGVYRHFRLSRHQIKYRFPFLTGLRISSW